MAAAVTFPQPVRFEQPATCVECVVALRKHHKRQLEEKMRLRNLWQDHGLVFPDSTGAPMRSGNLSRRHFKPLLKAAGLPPLPARRHAPIRAFKAVVKGLKKAIVVK